ncbi:HNH endonuclease [Achromobacter pestifer]
MATASPKPCRHAGCSALVYDGSGWCDRHRPAAWSVKRGGSTKRITGRKLQRLRAELFAAEPLCVECLRQGRVRLATQRDHKKPLFEGGTEEPDNVQGLCDDCHEEKSLAERLRAQRR